MHIWVCKLTIIGSDNGLLPGRRQAIIWTNAGILSIWPLGTNFSGIIIEIYRFSFKKMHLKMPSGKMAAILSRPQCVNKYMQLHMSKITGKWVNFSQLHYPYLHQCTESSFVYNVLLLDLYQANLNKLWFIICKITLYLTEQIKIKIRTQKYIFMLFGFGLKSVKPCWKYPHEGTINRALEQLSIDTQHSHGT